jgi:hypothetical protein
MSTFSGLPKNTTKKNEHSYLWEGSNAYFPGQSRSSPHVELCDVKIGNGLKRGAVPGFDPVVPVHDWLRALRYHKRFMFLLVVNAPSTFFIRLHNSPFQQGRSVTKNPIVRKDAQIQGVERPSSTMEQQFRSRPTGCRRMLQSMTGKSIDA